MAKIQASDVIADLQKQWNKKHGMMMSPWNIDLLQWVIQRLKWLDSKGGSSADSDHTAAFESYVATVIAEKTANSRSVYLLSGYVRPVLARIGVIVDVVTPTRERIACTEKVLERAAQ